MESASKLPVSNLFSSDHFVRYGFAVATVVLALLAAFLLERYLGLQNVYIVFCPAIALVALVAGGGPGLVVTVLSAALLSVRFIQTTPSESTAFALYLAGGVMVSGIAEVLRRRRRHSLHITERKLADATREIRELNAKFAANMKKHTNDLDQLRLVRAVVEHARDAVIVTEAEPIDEPGPRILYVNPAFLRETGYTEQEVLGRSPRFLQGPDSDRAALGQIRHALRNWQSSRVEVLNYKKDGTSFWAELDITPIADSTGWFTHWIAIQRDVTARKTAEATAHVREADLARAQATAHLGSWRWDLARETVTWSEELFRIFGVEPSTFVPSNDAAIRMIHPQDRDQHAFAVAEAQACRTIPPFECRVIRPNGNERTVLASSFDVEVDTRGRAAILFGTVLDITDRKRVDAAMRESERRWRDMAEALPQLIWTCAPDGKCDYLSRQWVEYTGQPESLQLGFGWLDQVHPDDSNHLREKWREAVTTGLMFDIDVRIRRADGMYRWFKTRALPVCGEDRRVVRWFGSNTDVDDLRRSTDALRESEERLRMFVEYAPVALAMFDCDMRYLVASHRWRTDYQLGDANLAGQCHYDVFPEISDAWRAVHRRAIAGEVVLAEEDRFDRHDGVVQWLRWEVRPWYTAGEVSGIMIFTEDISLRKQADEKLRESDNLLRMATDNAAVGLVLLDRNRRYIFANQTYCKILGLPWTPNELIGLGPAEVLQDVYVSQIAPRLDRVYAGERVSYELSRTSPNSDSDQMAHYVVVYDPKLNGSGGVDQVIVTIFDITERKRAEHALVVSEERLRMAQAAGGIGIYDWNVATGVSVWTQIQEAIYGIPPSTFGGRHDDWLRQVHPDDLGWVAAELERCFAERRGDNYSEYRIVRGDGEVRWVANRCRTTYDSNGRPTRMIGTTIDVTDRRLAEVTIRERESRLAAILDTAADSIITISKTGAIESVNRAAERMFGYIAAELLGNNVSLLMPPPHCDHHDEYLARYSSMGEPKIIGIGRELTARRKDGSTFPIELAVSEIDHLRQFTGIIRDIAQRKELEREVVEAASEEQRRIGQDLHDTVGQELTALTIQIDDLSDALRTDTASAPELAARMGRVLRRCQSELRAVIRGLLPVAVEANGLMAALADLVDSTSQESGVRCEFNCPNPVAVTDNLTATQLYLIVKEAVHNAVKHANATMIRVALTSISGGGLMLRVTDDGRGIPSIKPTSRGQGLRITRHRAAIIGARLTIETGEHTGTVISCELSGEGND